MTMIAMRTLAKWHIWLGWLVGVPIVMWLGTGLLMVARPIEEVRGEHLRMKRPAAALLLPGSDLAGPDAQLSEMRVQMQNGRAVAVLTALDGSVRRVDFVTGAGLAPLDAAAARALVAREITGGDAVERVTLFPANRTPFDFRRPPAVWQVALANGTNVYVGRDTGAIEAVRTRWWRAFDLAWGLHIMDWSARETIASWWMKAFAFGGLMMSLAGAWLLARRLAMGTLLK